MANTSSISSMADLLEQTTAPIKHNIYGDIQYTEWESVSYEHDIINEAAEQRNLWYVKIDSNNVTPCINEDSKLSLSYDEAVKVYASITDLIQTKAQDYIDLVKLNHDRDTALILENSLLKSLKEFCRYIPDLNNQDASYFIDQKTVGIGATIKKSGTLSLLVHEPGCVDFSYARRAKHGGLVRITGTANFTQYTKNSEYLGIILGLVEGK
ncbi:hypothetical protein [Pseudomonas viridiflava]|uniref:hypothetical protein n=1 Tax=Pseudomonas viridiflava TaxID=33069 RepID=UPI000F01E6E0|nr:hypothetical protein [Pseudomonas viridiflava]